MSMYVLLGVIIVLLYLLYRKFDIFVSGKHNQESGNYEASAKEWLHSISRQLSDMGKDMSNISNYYQLDNPAGIKSNRFKRLANLTKIYADHLSKKEGLSEKNALIKARFELYQYGDDYVIDQIDEDMFSGTYWLQRRESEKDYYDSNIIEKDMDAFWSVSVKGVKKIMPFDLFSPVYDVLVKQEYKNGQAVEIGWTLDEDSYRDFIKHRAIINTLTKMGVLKKINSDGWGGKPQWIFTNTNLAELKRTIYEGGSSHGDDYFEEQWREGKLDRVFNTRDLDK